MQQELSFKKSTSENGSPERQFVQSIIDNAKAKKDNPQDWLDWFYEYKLIKNKDSFKIKAPDKFKTFTFDEFLEYFGLKKEFAKFIK